MNPNQSVHNAINDLATIRRAIEKAGGENPSVPSNGIALDGGLIFQGLCLLISLALLAYEIISGGEMSQIMMQSVHDQEIGFVGLAQVAVTGVALVMCLYFLAWRGAHHAEQSFNLPTRLSRVFAVASLVVAVAQYLGHSVQLLWPLLHFSVVTAVSVWFLSQTRREASGVTQTV